MRAEFARKRENAVSTNAQLEQEAQAVLDVIENPDVAQALRQDKMQNLQYLKDHYNVRQLLIHSFILYNISKFCSNSSLSNKSPPSTTLANSNTHMGTTAVPQTTSTTSAFSPPTPISPSPPTGVS